MVALMTVVLIGFLALVVDLGLLYAERTELQRGVDAAALAGADDINTTSNSASDALTYAQNNGISAGEVIANQAATVGPGYNAWTVTAQRSVNLLFAPVLGFTNTPVTATATAIKSPLQALDCNIVFCMPYVAWAGNSSGVYRHPDAGGLQPGDTVVYKDNGWVKTVVTDNPSPCQAPAPWPTPAGQTPPTCHWDVNNGSDFKGYLHQPSGMNGVMWSGENLAPIPAKGGSADPTSLTNQLCAMAGKTPGIVIAVDPAVENSGQITFTIIGFVALNLNTDICTSGGSHGSGTVLKSSTLAEGLPGVGPGTPSSVYILKLWQ